MFIEAMEPRLWRKLPRRPEGHEQCRTPGRCASCAQRRIAGDLHEPARRAVSGRAVGGTEFSDGPARPWTRTNSPIAVAHWRCRSRPLHDIVDRRNGGHELARGILDPARCDRRSSPTGSSRLDFDDFLADVAEGMRRVLGHFGLPVRPANSFGIGAQPGPHALFEVARPCVHAGLADRAHRRIAPRQPRRNPQGNGLAGTHRKIGRRRGRRRQWYGPLKKPTPSGADAGCRVTLGGSGFAMLPPDSTADPNRSS